jgi:hypothetical protein
MSMIDPTTRRPLRIANLDAEAEMIFNLTKLWADAAGAPVEVRVIGERVIGYTTELGALRIASDWSHLARNRYPETRSAGVLGWCYSMDHCLRMEPCPERIAA